MFGFVFAPASTARAESRGSIGKTASGRLAFFSMAHGVPTPQTFF
jgi:hypothetical protein